jgi:predicted nucleic acid-binding protein
MPNPERIVINTSPLIALVAAWGNLTILQSLYQEVLVPFEVCQELLSGGANNFAVTEFAAATWLQKQPAPINISPLLLNSLDLGEASVIQLALNQNIQTVCIDEALGRRVARLSSLSLTGSIGILLKAKQSGYPFSMQQAIQQMLNHGIRLSNTVINFALTQAGENNLSN